MGKQYSVFVSESALPPLQINTVQINVVVTDMGKQHAVRVSGSALTAPPSNAGVEISLHMGKRQGGWDAWVSMHAKCQFHALQFAGFFSVRACFAERQSQSVPTLKV